MSSVAHIIRRRRARKARQKAQAGRNRLWSAIILTVLALVIGLPLGVAGGLAAYFYLRATPHLPSPAETIYLDPIVGVTTLYARDEITLLDTVSDPLGEQRIWIALADLPPYVAQATLMMEDDDFLTSTTFSLSHTLNQLWRYALGNDVRRDASIAGRLTRNALVPLARASNLDPLELEIVFNAEIVRRYSPEQLLEWHLNTNYYGKDAYGIDAAARIYLGKPAVELTLDEAALLAAIPLSPQFNPFDNPNAARGRQADLLRAMLASGWIERADFEVAANRLTPLRTTREDSATLAPEFVAYAREQAENILNWSGLDGARLVARGGLRIITTLDVDLYEQAECGLRAHLAQLRNQPPEAARTVRGAPCNMASALGEVFNPDQAALPDDGALIILDATNGEIQALVGPADASAYQPGPVLHPFVYLEGFLSGNYTPATMVLDIPQTFPGPAEGLIYIPSNIDGQFRGPLSLRDAMAAQLLPPVVSIADTQRLNRVLSTAHVIGLNSLEESASYDLSLLERGGQVRLLDIAYAYSVFANGGVLRGVDTDPIARNFRARDPVAILRIEDNAGQVLWAYDDERRTLSRTNIIGADLAYLVNDILADNPTRQRVLNRDLSMLNIGRPAAVVSGLTRDRVDNWAVGYTPQRVIGVYMGRGDRIPLSLDTYGLQGAPTLWQAVARYAHERDALPAATWSRPDSVTQYVVCEKSGLTPVNSPCPTRTELFLRAVPPLLADTYWQTFQLNSQTLQRATANTPPNLRIDSVFFVPPAPALDWWESNGLPLPPREYDILSRPEILRTVQIFVPGDFEAVGGMVDIRGSIDTEEPISLYQLSYGQGLNPSQWFEIGQPQTTFTPGVSLGTWDTTGLDGIYTLQLAVTLANNSRDADFVQVTIDNIAPVIALQAGEPGQVFTYPGTTSVPIVANVTDNLGLDRVEFYRNGVLLGVDRDWPYGFEFTIERPGIEVFRAVAFDNVGNQASTELQLDIIREP